jgi:3-hydroxyacyl-CoA dehydrogenase
MTAPAQAAPVVGLIGVGEIGAGWAALAAAHGWRIAVFDTNVTVADRIASAVARRARALAALGRADAAAVEHGLRQIKVARSLLQAAGEADWIIESVPEDLALKQRLYENIGQVSKTGAVVSSSSSGLPITDIASRHRDQARCAVAHPLNPPELIPLVEVVPGKFTAPATSETLRGWLRLLGRIPIVLKREVPGNAVGRIAAAVWRECIDLVLSGVMDVDDIDRAVSLGPGLGWAAGGPHLTYHLAAGEAGVGVFLQQLMQSFETWWSSLAQWNKLEPEQVRALAHQIEKAYGGKVDALREARDRRLAAILKGLESARKA